MISQDGDGDGEGDRNLAARISSARSLLFVPGDRPDRIKKALASAAHAVIVDLEDAVRAEDKPFARSVAAGIRHRPSAPLLLIRTNAFGSADFAADLATVFEGGADGVVIPKFVPGAAAAELDDALSAAEAARGRVARMPVIGLIESAAGVLALSSPADFPARVIRLAFGAADLTADLRISYRASGVVTDHVMVAMVVASAAAGLAEPIDSPHFSLDDGEGLVERARKARELGFGGGLCIHPQQVATVNAAFEVSTNERRWAERVLAAWAAPSSPGRGAIRLDGELVDEAMVRRARQIADAAD